MSQKLNKEKIIKIATQISDTIKKEAGGDSLLSHALLDEVASQVRLDCSLGFYEERLLNE